MFLTFHYNSPISITYHSPRISIAEAGAASTSTPCISTEAVMVDGDGSQEDAGDDWWRMCQQRAPGTHCTLGGDRGHASNTPPPYLVLPPPPPGLIQHPTPAWNRQ